MKTNLSSAEPTKPLLALILFDRVQQIRQQRYRRSKTGKTSLFSGPAYCADCGEKMYCCTTKDFEKRQDFFECSVHHKHKEDCKTHFIRAVVLKKIVWHHMEVVLSYVLRYEAYFRAKIQMKLQLEGEEKIRVQQHQLTKA